jgi:hypothetical protein
MSKLGTEIYIKWKIGVNLPRLFVAVFGCVIAPPDHPVLL